MHSGIAGTVAGVAGIRLGFEASSFLDHFGLRLGLVFACYGLVGTAADDRWNCTVACLDTGTGVVAAAASAYLYIGLWWELHSRGGEPEVYK